MAQIGVSPLLSLCIPIYNRLSYLNRQLEKFLKEKDLFENQIQLIISDNCSEDDLKVCCEKYQQQGLNLRYHRNECNIGPDGNFEWCFRHADGKYVWLLGSDDIPINGILAQVVAYLSDNDYGLVHLAMRKANKELTIYNNHNDMVVAVNYWITFISSNIICRESLKTINLSEYNNTLMIQVPAYLNACFFSKCNAVIYQPLFFERESDAANNGGYDIFEVFVTNLYSIYEKFINKEMLSKAAFTKIMKIEFKDFLLKYIVSLLVFRHKSNFRLDNSWNRLFKYYGRKPYFYGNLLKGVGSVIIYRLTGSAKVLCQLIKRPFC